MRCFGALAERAIFARISFRDDRFANPIGQVRSQNAREATAAEISLSYRDEHSLKFHSFVGIRSDCRCSLSSAVFSLNESNVFYARVECAPRGRKETTMNLERSLPATASTSRFTGHAAILPPVELERRNLLTSFADSVERYTKIRLVFCRRRRRSFICMLYATSSRLTNERTNEESKREGKASLTTSTNISRSCNEGTHRVNRREKKEESNVNFRATKISIDVCSPVCRLRHLYI
jgi:hypothetical protein